MKLLVLMVLLTIGSSSAGPLDETRWCSVTPKRDADGSITRRADVLQAFRNIHPCPSTGLKRGPCKGWAMDHVIPLAKCGCDSVSNLQWFRNEIKSCAGQFCKDRWERKIYSCPPPEKL